ncbi:MAG: permease, partial [Clostridia bacterium]|nr:permease [Clostridia bacterium]
NGTRQASVADEGNFPEGSDTSSNSDARLEDNKIEIRDKIRKSTSYAFGTFLSDISVHFIVGLLVAALISVLIPDTLLVELGINSGIWAMLVMIVIGLPMYICSTSSIPIALTLMAKGVSPGAAFVFLFMGPFTNVASLAVISKKMGKKTTVLYVAAAILTALAFGFLLDALAPVLNFPVYEDMHHHGVTGAWDIFKIAVAGLFFLFVFYSIFKKIRAKLIKVNKTDGKELTFKVEGMHCDGCASGLRDKLISSKGISNAEVSFETSSATVSGKLDPAEIISIIEKAGYTGTLLTGNQTEAVCTDSCCS